MASSSSIEASQSSVAPKSSRQLVRGDSSTKEALFGLLCGVTYGATSPLVAHPYARTVGAALFVVGFLLLTDRSPA